MNAQLQNLYALLDTGERILANPIACALGFARVDCGSYACLIGWHVRFHGNDARLVYRYDEDPLALWFMHSARIEQHFGINEEEMDKLFGSVEDINDLYDTSLDEEADEPGPAAYKELRRRLAYLRNLIAQREAALGIEPRTKAAA